MASKGAIRQRRYRNRLRNFCREIDKISGADFVIDPDSCDEYSADDEMEVPHSDNTSSEMDDTGSNESDCDMEPDVEITEEMLQEPTVLGATVKSSLAAGLMIFMTKFSVSYRAMQFLLTLLTFYGVDVPSSVYKLAKTGVDEGISGAINDRYYYFSVFGSLKYLAERALLPMVDGLSLQLKIYADGFPLFKSSPKKAWPIYMSISNPGICSKLMPVAVHLDNKGPELLSYVFLLVNELKEAMTNGFQISNSVKM